MSKLIETTGQVDKKYDEWVSMLEKLDDISVSREIFNRIITEVETKLKIKLRNM